MSAVPPSKSAQITALVTQLRAGLITKVELFERLQALQRGAGASAGAGGAPSAAAAAAAAAQSANAQADVDVDAAADAAAAATSYPAQAGGSAAQQLAAQKEAMALMAAQMAAMQQQLQAAQQQQQQQWAQGSAYAFAPPPVPLAAGGGRPGTAGSQRGRRARASVGDTTAMIGGSPKSEAGSGFGGRATSRKSIVSAGARSPPSPAAPPT
jgi:hypothetical protein